MTEQQILRELHIKFPEYDIKVDHKIFITNDQFLVVDFAVFKSETQKCLIAFEMKRKNQALDTRRMDELRVRLKAPVYILSIDEGELSFIDFGSGEDIDFNTLQEFLQEDILAKVVSDFSGVEETEDYNQEEIKSPFNPEDIKIQQQLLSVKYLYELYQDKAINLSPDFQRGYVWKENKRKSHLIESLMLSIPIPAFYLFEADLDSDEYEFVVIDGQQRLTTIFDFLNDKFRLSSLEYLGEKYNKCKFSDLPPKIQSRINRTQLALNTLSYDSPHRIVYDIFKRINTGGKALNHQEMRNAVSSNITRELMNSCADSKVFLQATGSRVKKLRLDHHELVLRFLAFYRIYDFDKGKINYKDSNIVDLLNDENEKLNKELNNELFSRYVKLFESSMKRSYQLFGDRGFLKVTKDKKTSKYEYSALINKPLFTAFSVILADDKYEEIDFSGYKNKVFDILSNKLSNSENFMAISTSTNSKSKVEKCFKMCNEVIEECLCEM